MSAAVEDVHAPLLPHDASHRDAGPDDAEQFARKVIHQRTIAVHDPSCLGGALAKDTNLHTPFLVGGAMMIVATISAAPQLMQHSPRPDADA